MINSIPNTEYCRYSVSYRCGIEAFDAICDTAFQTLADVNAKHCQRFLYHLFMVHRGLILLIHPRFHCLLDRQIVYLLYYLLAYVFLLIIVVHNSGNGANSKQFMMQRSFAKMLRR
jgi:hypothetical protein